MVNFKKAPLWLWLHAKYQLLQSTFKNREIQINVASFHHENESDIKQGKCSEITQSGCYSTGLGPVCSIHCIQKHLLLWLDLCSNLTQQMR